MVTFPKKDESITTIGMRIVAPEIAAHITNVFNIFRRKSISRAIGTPNKAANGQPRSADIAMKKTANVYF